jgi:hypothetical protein
MILLADVLAKESCHQFQRFFRFWKLEVIPERMRQRFEDNQLRVVSRRQQRAMKNRCITQQDISRARHQQYWRPGMQVREHWRQHRIAAVRLCDILIIQMAGIHWLHRPRKSIQSE